MATLVDTKICVACGAEKPVDEFPRWKSDGTRHPRCKPCKNASKNGWYARLSPEAHVRLRNANLRVRYGITLDLLKSIYEQQEGCCAICGTAGNLPYRERGSDIKGSLVVDHDHETGEVRGLLCRKCNSALGQLGDSSTLLIRALYYLLDRGGG